MREFQRKIWEKVQLLRGRLWLSLLVLLVWSLGLGTVCLFFAKADYGRAMFWSYWDIPLTVFLNLLPVLLFVFLLFAVTNRVWLATLLSGGVLLSGVFANLYKILYRSDPVLWADLAFAKEALGFVERYEPYLTVGIVLCIAAVLLGSLFCFFFVRGKLPLRGRIAACLILPALCLGCYFGLICDDELYAQTENLDVELPDERWLSPWNRADQYVSRGFVYPFLHSIYESSAQAPEDYSESGVLTLLERCETEPPPEEERVHFLCVMLEAYNDLSALMGLEFPAELDPYAGFHRLQAEGIPGNLVTNIFAGGTIDTERGFITGSTVLNEYRGAAWSYARWFDELGYRTEFHHPGYGWFYNRQNVMEYLGFDESFFIDTLYAMPWEDTIMLDREVFGILRERLAMSAAEDTPFFGFLVTYQNHGPYADSYLYDTENEFVPRGELSAESYYILNNYLWGIRETDRALTELTDALRDSEEPVVLLLFGDHNPWLGDHSFVYAELGVDLSRTTDESFYNYYRTPWLLWGNDAAKELLGEELSGEEGGEFSPCFLMPRMLELCGWEGPEPAVLARALEKRLDVVHESGSVRENGVLTREPSDGARALWEDYERLQYYLLTNPDY